MADTDPPVMADIIATVRATMGSALNAAESGAQAAVQRVARDQNTDLFQVVIEKLISQVKQQADEVLDQAYGGAEAVGESASPDIQELIMDTMNRVMAAVQTTTSGAVQVLESLNAGMAINFADTVIASLGTTFGQIAAPLDEL